MADAPSTTDRFVPMSRREYFDKINGGQRITGNLPASKIQKLNDGYMEFNRRGMIEHLRMKNSEAAKAIEQGRKDIADAAKKRDPLERIKGVSDVMGSYYRMVEAERKSNRPEQESLTGWRAMPGATGGARPGAQPGAPGGAQPGPIETALMQDIQAIMQEVIGPAVAEANRKPLQELGASSESRLPQAPSSPIQPQGQTNGARPQSFINRMAEFGMGMGAPRSTVQQQPVGASVPSMPQTNGIQALSPPSGIRQAPQTNGVQGLPPPSGIPQEEAGVRVGIDKNTGQQVRIRLNPQTGEWEIVGGS